VNKPTEVLKKSEMTIDTNPKANWLIMFVNHRESNDKTHVQVMEFTHNMMWATKRVIQESINIGYVDIATPTGELLRHSFDIDGIPTAVLVDE